MKQPTSPLLKRYLLIAASLLALTLVAFVLASLHMVFERLRSAREQELAIHAQRVAAALEAQLFERFADSQAFALNRALERALLNPRTEADEAHEVLLRLLKIYKVYRGSVLADLDGKLISSALLQGEIDPKKWAALPRITATEWKTNPNAPKTRVSRMEFVNDANSIFGEGPTQSFTSPIYRPDGRLLGTITNYASGLYIEREMAIIFSGFEKLNLPPISISIYDDLSRNVVEFRRGGVEYNPPPTSETAEWITAESNLSDARIGGRASFRVVLKTGRAAFLAQINRMRAISYSVTLGFLFLLIFAVHFVYRLRIRYDRILSKRLHEASEAERLRISREIHDDLGQTLTAIKIHLARAKLEEPETLAEKLREAREMIEETNQVVRRISHELHPSLVENLGLEDALRWKLQQLQEVTDLSCTLVVGAGARVDEIARDKRIHVFRIIQEALNNIQKHAKSESAEVRFERDGSEMNITISDQGVGFDIATSTKNSLGLRSIEERAKLIGGKLRIKSLPGRGTVISCRLPLENPERIGHGA